MPTDMAIAEGRVTVKVGRCKYRTYPLMDRQLKAHLDFNRPVFLLTAEIRRVQAECRAIEHRILRSKSLSEKETLRQQLADFEQFRWVWISDSDLAYYVVLHCAGRFTIVGAGRVPEYWKEDEA